LLRILVRNGADGVVAAAVDDLVGMRSDDDLVHQHLCERAPVFCRQVFPRERRVGQFRHGRLACEPVVDGPTPFGDNPADLLASAEQLLRRICVLGAPSRLFGLRSQVVELVWEANTGAGA
jgi:hypothetical protein